MKLLPLVILFTAALSAPRTILANSYDLIPPVTVGNSERKPPACDPKNGEDKCAKYYSNDALSGFKCSYSLPVSDSFSPHESQPTAAPSATPPPSQFDPYDVNRIDTEYQSVKDTNANDRTSSLYWAKAPPIDPNASVEDRRTMETSYREPGLNTTTRTLPYSVKTYLKGQLIEQAARSLSNQDEITTDEQLGWACGGSFQKLIPKPSGCRPVTITEIGYYFLQAGDSTSYKLKEYNELEKIGLPGDVSSALSKHYEQGGYNRRFGTGFSLMNSSSYKILYRDMPVVPRGSANTVLTIHNLKATPNGAGETVMVDTVEVKNKTMPLEAPISSSQVAYTHGMLRPAAEVPISQTDQICTSVAENKPIEDKPSPVTFWTWIERFFGTIFKDPATFSDVVIVDKSISNSTVNNIDTDETFLRDMMPQKDLDKYQFQNFNKSSTGGISDSNDPQPGLRNSQQREYFYFLTAPQSWRSDPKF
jgi:hypothetical protein